MPSAAERSPPKSIPVFWALNLDPFGIFPHSNPANKRRGIPYRYMTLVIIVVRVWTGGGMGKPCSFLVLS